MFFSGLIDLVHQAGSDESVINICLGLDALRRLNEEIADLVIIHIVGLLGDLGFGQHAVLGAVDSEAAAVVEFDAALAAHELNEHGRFKDVLRSDFKYWRCDNLNDVIAQAIHYFNYIKPLRKLNRKTPVQYRIELAA